MNKNLSLIVEFSDYPRASWEMGHTGELNIKRRIVIVPLTEEQIKMLEPRELGEATSYGKTTTLHEDYRIICLQEVEEDKNA